MLIQQAHTQIYANEYHLAPEFRYPTQLDADPSIIDRTPRRRRGTLEASIPTLSAEGPTRRVRT